MFQSLHIGRGSLTEVMLAHDVSPMFQRLSWEICGEVARSRWLGRELVPSARGTAGNGDIRSDKCDHH